MIRIMTDSAADMSEEELHSWGVERIPMQLSIGSDSYEDGSLLSPDLFWSRLAAGETAKTSQPSPDAFLSHFEHAVNAGDSVVLIAVSSALSGTYQSAKIARDMAEGGEIHVVDSLLAAPGQKMLVWKACQMRDAGIYSAEEIANELLSLRSRVKLYAALDTLEYLARGGRIPQAAASLGGLVHLKPIITLTSEGKVGLSGKALGISRSFSQLLNLTKNTEIDTDYPVIPIYSHKPHNCEAFLPKFAAAYPSVVCEAPQPIGTTIATHIGPGAYGIVYVEK